jgi:mannose/fructose/N-acetylgalactosamine-specific phosphotransferase system component IIC
MLRRAAAVALVGGAIVSLGVMLNSARNTPALLIFLYSGWVLLPYVGAAVSARWWSRRGSTPARPVHAAALVMTILALTAYLVAPLLPHPPRAAAVFLMVPLASLGVIGVALAVAAARYRTSSSPTNPTNTTS